MQVIVTELDYIHHKVNSAELVLKPIANMYFDWLELLQMPAVWQFSRPGSANSGFGAPAVGALGDARHIEAARACISSAFASYLAISSRLRCTD